MFYREEDIDEAFICPICNLKFNDPRILPCGNTICQECVELIFQNYKKLFICVICNQSHPYTNNTQFPKNRALNRLISKQAKEVYRNKLVKEFKTALDLLKIKLDDLKEAKINHSENIREYCETVRYEIEIAAECAILEIHKNRDMLLNKVNSYENQFLENLNKYQNQSDKKKFIKKADEFYGSFDTIFKNTRIDEERVSQNLIPAKNLIKEVENEIEFLKSHMNVNSMKFVVNNKSNEPESLLGTLEIEKFYEPNVCVNLKKHFETHGNTQDMTKTFISRLNNGDFIIAQKISNQNVILFRINHKNKVVNTTNVLIENDFQITNNGIRIFLKIDDNILKSFDNNLKILKERKISKIENSILASNSSYIFVITNKFINVFFTKNLNYILCLNLNKMNSNLPFYVPFKISEAKVYDEKFFFFSKSSLKIIDCFEGNLVNEISIKAQSFSISNGRIIFLDESSNRFVFYDINGNYESTLNLDSNIKAHNLKFIENNFNWEISLYDSSNSKLYL